MISQRVPPVQTSARSSIYPFTYYIAPKRFVKYSRYGRALALNPLGSVPNSVLKPYRTLMFQHSFKYSKNFGGLASLTYPTNGGITPLFHNVFWELSMCRATHIVRHERVPYPPTFVGVSFNGGTVLRVWGGGGIYNTVRMWYKCGIVRHPIDSLIFLLCSGTPYYTMLYSMCL